MNVIQITDWHFKNEEPFFNAGVALGNYLLDYLKAEKEPFIFLDSGDHFHVSKETGRVNGLVTKFFLSMAEISKCHHIVIMQGNHDVKEETGSALGVLTNLHPAISVITEPYFIVLGNTIEAQELIYILPHIQPFSIPGYSSMKSYGDENFHREYWKIKKGFDWDTLIKPKIKLVSLHGGDETTGKLFMNVDISFLPGLRSNGHIHKQMSPNHLPSVAITRRDEKDKKCFIRRIDTSNWKIEDVEIPLFLNYVQIPYGSDVTEYPSHFIMPKESLIVDIYGHDDKSLVVSEYAEKWAERQNPKLYIGEVTPTERRGEAVTVEEYDELDISSINIKELLIEFCEEKKIAKEVVDDLVARVG